MLYCLLSFLSGLLSCLNNEFLFNVVFVKHLHFSFSFGLLLREGAGLVDNRATADCSPTVCLSQTNLLRCYKKKKQRCH